MSVEFTLEGLTPRQRVLADIIWACEEMADILKFIKTLPTVAMQQEARSIVDLMKMAAVEQCYEDIAEPMDVKTLLAKISIRK